MSVCPLQKPNHINNRHDDRDVPRLNPAARRKQQRHPHRNRWLLPASFAGVFLLFSLATAVSTHHAWRSNEHAQAIANELNAKTLLINRMRNAARERSLELYAMTSLPDPFQRDEAFMRFKEYAAEFIVARQALQAHDLSRDERAILQHQSELTRRVYPIQERIVELVQNDRLEEARDLITRHAVPLQTSVLNVLNELMNIQLDTIGELAAMEARSQHRNLVLTLGLGLVALLIGIAITIMIVRYISRTEQRLQMEKYLAELTLSSIADAVISTDSSGRIRAMNAMAEYLTGFRFRDVAGRPVTSVLRMYHEEDRSSALDPVSQVIESRETYKSDYDLMLLRNDQTEFGIESTVSPIIDQNDVLRGTIVVFRDVTEIRSLSSTLSYQARHDALTGLINRREFEERLDQAIKNARHEKITHALCFLDLDQLKTVNDAAGHAAGDELLKQIAQRLSSILRRSDVLARFGGDEFGVLLEGCNEAKALDIAEAMRRKVKETRFSWGNNAFDVSISIGLVMITGDSGDVTRTMAAADTACYAAKENGRNRIETYQVDSKVLSERRREMRRIHDIRLAIETNGLELYGQKIKPLPGTNDDRPFVEVLVRMRHADGKLILPNTFIPVCERYNLMPELDRWVIETVLRQFGSRRQKDPARQHACSINVSGQSISNPGFVDAITAAIERSNIPSGALCFELTETAAIANMSTAFEFINRVRALGCRFSLDDFGSGLCSFSYLKNMPVDYLKIDGSFILDICHDPVDHAFVDTIHRIGEMMGIQTIAEYVETPEILERVIEIGISYAQGFEIDLPRPLAEFSATANPVSV